MRARRPPLVTLLTDFGQRDGYVGAMKGALLSCVPGLTLIDLSHDIAPFDVRAAGYLLASAAFDFPPGTIHVAVVDPGVGGRRRLLIAETEGQRFLVPDNGLLDICRLRARVWRWYHVTRFELAHHPIAPTFHGRDLFAPLAAALARGVSATRMGVRLRDVPLRLGLPPASADGDRLCGTIMHVDRFGSLMSTIDGQAVRRCTHGASCRVRIGGHVIRRWVRTYADAPRGTAVALIGSLGWLEISVVEGSASDRLRVGCGDSVVLERDSA